MSNNNVFDYRDINFKNIKLKKAIFHSDNFYTIPLKYNFRDFDHELIFQTPELPVYNGVTEYVSNKSRKIYF